MTTDGTDTPDPTFVAERESDGQQVLVPQSQPSRLAAEDRQLYDALREYSDTRSGAIVAPPALDVDEGDTVSQREVVDAFVAGVGERLAAVGGATEPLRELAERAVETTSAFAEAADGASEK
jgi:hypothetical protein